jgi:predicted metal-binding protein
VSKPESASGLPSSGAPGPRNILQICRTCPREAPLPANGSPTLGRALALEVSTAFEDWNGADDWTLRVVHCLGGCPNPCNVALAAPGKWRLRFKRLSPEDAGLVLQLCELHQASRDGNLAPGELPAPLRQRISSRTPPPPTPRR